MRGADEQPRAAPDAETIAAIATPPGRGGIGVVRISGARVPMLAQAVLGSLPPPRCATLCVARDARGTAIDQGIALYFAAPHSYTGEAVLEFQGHGGPVVLQMVLSAFLDGGARLAGPGEFTQRAFLRGRIDLAQAESVADLIDAASREAARSAMRSLAGEFSEAIHALVAALTELRALTEAMLDFPEEEVDALHRVDAEARLKRVRAALAEVLAKSRQGSLLRTGINVVLAGRPNVGKSSLLNRLAGEERAIVTAVPGTTRDALREAIQIQGVPINVIDTAGLRESNDEIERLGIEHARRELGRADVVLVVFDASVGLLAEDRTVLAQLPGEGRHIGVFNKIDLAPGAGNAVVPVVEAEVRVSAKTGAGMEDLRRALLEAVGWQAHGEGVYLARERHLRALARAQLHLQSAAEQQGRWEFFAEELRLAQAALSEICGQFSADDLLGEIFARFCIGK
ncbi:MAG: tRNA uridine-5-carboxymethylaminomethyl(34) synthesis GTPase MnmE [Betaproteobacteria bacterium RIFCSPLOWO2_02_FULL_68_150]|nr:MAG: tRNA uridine-5-carboxymethylaminomethyl(34) synthesis GTPase MnmE [Betaproteobacteria bacterium RIFCSPLOWO2_02_FULL_68_150]